MLKNFVVSVVLHPKSVRFVHSRYADAPPVVVLSISLLLCAPETVVSVVLRVK